MCRMSYPMKKIDILVQYLRSHILTLRFRFLTRLFCVPIPLRGRHPPITGLAAEVRAYGGGVYSAGASILGSRPTGQQSLHSGASTLVLEGSEATQNGRFPERNERDTPTQTSSLNDTLKKPTPSPPAED